MDGQVDLDITIAPIRPYNKQAGTTATGRGGPVAQDATIQNVPLNRDPSILWKLNSMSFS